MADSVMLQQLTMHAAKKSRVIIARSVRHFLDLSMGME
jgi:hypothetical protein